MEAGTKVYRYEMFGAITDFSRPFYRQEATATGIVLDGKQMVRLHDLLIPSDGWHATEREAKAAAVTALVRRIGQLQAVVDTFRDEVLHEDLTTEAAL